ncbi:hypothetical protein Sgly_1930 [Syntrophobotulus glycolicus DSM 8271]|uniref:Prepilin-type N-terminal cleavage/methylation domain-containing protein n=1 Tax=Syntrophobotulus glycolicus (strain DSM 8271 / FlGlyR) TaxID=645991 RepID=F0T0T7_SYNGF|nr:prepilin-type N-terminal cleavage/methylation domain-containing protein [Syntrophobotulus glycolicus]ADY56226.1 hypothetical protein Sgly_1930 [Syntrophobotulus glycolicus DSM 8271]
MKTVKIFQSDKGLTLIEVITSLLIISILASLALGIYIGKYKAFFELKNGLEKKYALFRGAQVIKESIRTAEKIEWSERGVLKIYQADQNPSIPIDQVIPDKFYIDDKDHDGRTDLYKEHLGVSNPVATGLGRIACKEVGLELWEVRLSLNHPQTEELAFMVRQRVTGQD